MTALSIDRAADCPPAIAGISGGRTSGMMAFLLPVDTVLCFQNTGREHSKTYEFIRRIEDDIGRPIVRLEFRAPPRGDAPKHATFEIVRHEHLSRRGEPFLDLLDCLASYRAKEKNAGPIAPWARQRICTSYLKIRTQSKLCKSLGWSDWTHYVGLRADEPDRVAKMRARNSERDGDERAPLFDRGITKADVLEFWSAKRYDLDLPEHLGNCTGCFLKDEKDLATALLDPETDAQWWIDIEKRYAPMRRGRSSFEQILAEAPARMQIREALAKGSEPPVVLDARRHRLIVRQEKEKSAPFSCACEGAFRLDDEELLADITAAADRVVRNEAEHR